TTAPASLGLALAQVLVAAAQSAGKPVPQALASVQASSEAQAIAASLASGQRVAIFLGNAAVSSDHASVLAANASTLAAVVNGCFGFLTPGANTVGGYLAGATPGRAGLSAEQMLA